MGDFLLLQWPLVALRASLVVGVGVALVQSFQGDVGASLCVLALWLPHLRHALTEIDDPGERRAASVLDEQVLLVFLACQLLQALDLRSQTPSATSDIAWLVPLLLAAVLNGIRAWRSDAVVGDDGSSDRRAWQAAMLALAVAAAVGLALTDTGRGATSLVLGLVQLALMVTMVLACESAMPRALYLMLCLLPLESAQAMRGAFIGGMALLVLLEHRRAAGAVGDWMRAMGDSDLLWQLLALACVAVQAQAMSRVWYRTHVDFPPSLRTFCGDTLDFLDGVPMFLYRLFTSPDWLASFGIALPEITALCNTMYRILVKIYPPLTICREGEDGTYTPGEDLRALGAFAVQGVVGVCVLLRLFPRGGTFFTGSPWLWALGALGGLASLVFAHLLADVSVAFWYFLFRADGGSYERSYTDAGLLALLAQCVFTLACLWLYVRAVNARAASPPDERGLLHEALAYATRPSLLLLALGVLLLLVTIASSGSPLRTYDIAALPPPRGIPDSLVQVSAVTRIASLGLTSLLSVLNPEERLALIAIAAERYFLEQLPCWGCICLQIPPLSKLVDAFEDTGDFLSSAFGRRRRLLLEHRATTTALGGRALLSSNTCSHDSCSYTQICVTDVVKDVVSRLSDLALQGIGIASRFVADEILSRIPLVSEVDRLLARLGDLDLYADFSLIDRVLGDVGLASLTTAFGMELGLLPRLRMPQLPAVDTGAVVALCVSLAVAALGLLAVAYRFGWLRPLARSGLVGFELLATEVVLVLFLGAVCFTALLHQALYENGREVKVAFYSNIYAYVLALALLVVSRLLWIAELSSSQTQAYQSVPAAPQPVARLFARRPPPPPSLKARS